MFVTAVVTTVTAGVALIGSSHWRNTEVLSDWIGPVLSVPELKTFYSTALLGLFIEGNKRGQGMMHAKTPAPIIVYVTSHTSGVLTHWCASWQADASLLQKSSSFIKFTPQTGTSQLLEPNGHWNFESFIIEWIHNTIKHCVQGFIKLVLLKDWWPTDSRYWAGFYSVKINLSVF